MSVLDYDSLKSADTDAADSVSFSVRIGCKWPIEYWLLGNREQSGKNTGIDAKAYMMLWAGQCELHSGTTS